MLGQGFSVHYATKHPGLKFPGWAAIQKMEVEFPPRPAPALEEAMETALQQPPAGEEGDEDPASAQEPAIAEDEPAGEREQPLLAPTPAAARQPTVEGKKKEAPATPPAEAGRPTAIREGRRSVAESLFFGQVKAVTINEWGWRTDLTDGKWLDMYFYNTMLDYGIRLYGYDKADDPDSLRLINAKAEKMAAEFIESRGGRMTAEVEARAQELVAEITTEQIQAAAMTIVRERLGSNGQ